MTIETRVRAIIESCFSQTREEVQAIAVKRILEEFDAENETLKPIEVLKAEAKKHGYRLSKIPDYDCSCYLPYPNERNRHKNGKWKCIDRFERCDRKPKSKYKPVTYCRRKDGEQNGN